MPTPDFFTSDAFELTQLTAAINAPVEGQAVPNAVDDLFQEEGVAVNRVYIEMRSNKLSLVPAAPYGSPGDPTEIDRRQVKGFDLIHLPTSGAVWAHEVQGVREFGTEMGLQTIESKRNAELAKMRMRLDATKRYHRIKALQGKIMDADGTNVLLDVFSEFGVTQQTKDFKLSVDTTKIKLIMENAKEMAEDALGDSTSLISWRCYAGRSWFDDFVTHPLVEKAFERWQDGAFLRGSQARQPFTAFGVDFIKLYGKVGGKEFINTNEAYLVPVVEDPDAYITRYGPADYAETINTIGLPYYAKAQVMDFNKGVNLEAQSNVLSLPTRPRSIIKLTKS